MSGPFENWRCDRSAPGGPPIGPSTEEEARREVLAVHPAARWMPWDVPPVGARVRRRDRTVGDPSATGVVLHECRVPVPDRVVHEGCEDCCGHAYVAPQMPRLFQWWVIRLDSELEVVEYPPALEPV